MTAPEVTTAAEHLIAAFAAGDPARYFACFSPDASFIFYTEPDIIRSREDYEQIWAGWEQSGFAIAACRSVDARVQMLTSDVGIFTHRVRTVVSGSDHELSERETIVFQRHEDGWLAVHEHLSPEPPPT